MYLKIISVLIKIIFRFKILAALWTISFLLIIIIPANAQVPQISVSPSNSEAAAPIILSGSGFDKDLSKNLIIFPGLDKPVPAEWVSTDLKNLMVRVPTKATGGIVEIKVNGTVIGQTFLKIKSTYPTINVFLALFGGVVARTLLPYIVKSIKSGSAWEWKYIVSSLATTVTVIPLAITILPNLTLSGNSYQDLITAFSLTYSSQDLIREAQKITEGPSE
jgi:hypothetical protein